MSLLKQIRNPKNVEQIDTAWFRQILEDKGPGPIRNAQILEVKKSTATKIRCEITYAADKGDAKETVWVKT